MAQKPMYEGINNSPITALDGDLSASATSIPVVAASAFPAPPSLCTIGTEDNAELVLYTGISGSKLTGCTRGYNGTTARAWPDETSVYRAFSDYDQKAIQDNIRDHEARIQIIEDSTAPNIIISESGPILEFSDGAEDRPLTALSVGITAAWAGSGDPSPENIRKISGWTGVKIRRTAKNLWGGDAVLDDVKDAIPSATVDAAARTVRFVSNAQASYAILGYASTKKVHRFRFKENTRYTFILALQKTSEVGSNLIVVYTDGSSAPIPALSEAGVKETKVFVTAAGKTVQYLGKNNSSGSTVFYADECGLFEGVLGAEEFEPYAGTEVSVDWESAAGEVYGGTLNVLTGELTVTHRGVVLTGEESWAVTSSDNTFYMASALPGAVKSSIMLICSHYPALTTGKRVYDNVYIDSGYRPVFSTTNVEHTVEAWTDYLKAQAAAGTPVTVVYKNRAGYNLTYQLTPAQLSTLFGENRIFADTGEVDLTYTADTKTYIDNKLAALTATMLENIGN